MRKICHQHKKSRLIVVLLGFFSQFYMGSAFAQRISQDTEYGIEECSPKGYSQRHLSVSFAQKTALKNEYLVGWRWVDTSTMPNYPQFMLGDEIHIMRCLSSGRMALVGTGLIESVKGNLIEARVQSTGTREHQAKFSLTGAWETQNLFWRPMAGDVILPARFTISKRATTQLEQVLSVEELFQKPHSMPDGAEEVHMLSPIGKDLLDEKFAPFEERGGKVLVEGFSNSDDENQEEENMLHARIVASYLIKRYGLSPELVFIDSTDDIIQSSRRIDYGVVLTALPDRY